MENLIEIYTDGSTVDNDDLFKGSGWAFIVPSLNIKQSGKAYGSEITTSQMELQAIVKALEFVVNNDKNNYIIYCDSQSTVKCFKGLGARKLYKELWNEAHMLINQVFANGSKIKIDFLDRGALDQNSDMFKYAQEVDRLAYIQANSLEII